MNKYGDMRQRIIDIAEENDWSVDMESNDGNNFTFEFSNFSPAGQDFSFCASMVDNNVETLIDNIYEKYNDYDCSQEAYYWLDSSGHGTNGAPYNMKELYEDMEACEQMMLDLHDALNAADWSEYEEVDEDE